MSLNCKPGQRAYIARRARSLSCVATMVGIPVHVSAIVQPTTVDEAIAYMADGPLWRLHSPVHCTRCGFPFLLLPDSILKPFDPDSEPKDDEQEDGEGNAPDVKRSAIEFQFGDWFDGVAHG